MTGRRSTSLSAFLLVLMGFLTVFVGASPAVADDCVALGGTLSAGECRITGTVSRSGSYAISTGLRITSTGSIVVPAAGPGAANSLNLTVAGSVNLDSPALGQAAIDGNATGVAAVGATVTIVAGGSIVMDGAGSVGAQIRTSGNTSSASGCSATAPPSPIWGRAGDITLTSTTGNITLGPGTKLTATGGCLGGAIELNTPSGSIDTRAAMLSKPGGTTTTAVVRGGPITLAAGGTLTVGPNSSIASQFTATASGAFNYGADRIHLESAGNMLIQGLVQSLGGANFGTDVFGGQNQCTGASRVGKPATSTSCVELWVGGTLTVDGGDPSKPGNTINGAVIARSGQNGLVNATDPSWIDAHVRGNVVLKGKPTAVGTNSFLFDAQQNSATARGGTISVSSYHGRVTASGRTFVADGATTDGGTGGLVTVEAAGPVDYPLLPSGQFRPADLNSNIDLGDSMQFARGANDGVVGGAGKIHFRSWNGQITGGPVAFLAPNTVVSLPAGTVVLPLVGVPITLPAATPVTLGNSTYHGRQFVKSVDATSVALPAGAPITLAAVDATVAVDTVVTAPGGTIVDPSLTALAGGCVDRLTGAVLVDPTTGQQYPCDDRTGVADGGGIGQTELIVTLCVGWLYNGVTRPLATTNVHDCGGRPTPPPDVVIPVAPTLQIFGGGYQYDGFERPARGTVDSGFVDIGGGHRVAAVVPRAYGQAGASEPLLPLPTVTYVDSSNNPVTVPIQVGIYTATAYFPGNDTYTPLTVTAPIIIFTQAPVVTVVGGIFRFDGQPHPATGVTTKDASTQAAIGSPATVLYYNCVPNASQPSWNPATDTSCKTTPPVQPTTTHLPPSVTLNDADAGHWIPVVAYFPGNSSYGPTWATARIAIWRPRLSVTTATGGTFVYDGNPRATTTTVADGGTDGLGATYRTQQSTVNPGTWTFTEPVTGAVGTSGATYDGTASPLHAVNVQAPVSVGTYPVRAFYPGDAMHSGSTGTNTIVITPRPVTITALGGSFGCDSGAHGATGSITTTNGAGQTVNLGSPLFIYTDSAGNVLSGPPTAAGTYTLLATLPQALAGNYAANPPTQSGTVTITSRTATVAATGGTFAYDGRPHPAAATVTGTGLPSGTQAVITYTKGGVVTGVPTEPGVYTATATVSAPGGCVTATLATATITITAPPAETEEACIVIDLREITYFKNSTVITSSDAAVRTTNGLTGGFKPSLWPYAASGGDYKTTSRGTLFRIYGFKPSEVGIGIPDADTPGKTYVVKEDTQIPGPGRFYVELNEPGGPVGGHPARVFICPSQLQTGLVDKPLCNSGSSGGGKDDGDDKDGYDKDGYDKDGYDKDGYGKDGYGKDGYGKDGYGKDGYDKDGYDKDGKDSKYGKDARYDGGYKSGSDDGKDDKDGDDKDDKDGKDGDGKDDDKDGKDDDDKDGKDDDGGKSGGSGGTGTSSCTPDPGIFAGTVALTAAERNVPGILLTHNASALTVPLRVRTELGQLGMPLQNPPGTATTKAAIDYIAVHVPGDGSATYREFVDVRVSFVDDSATDRRQHYAGGLHTATNVNADSATAYGCDYLDSDPANDTIRLNDGWDGTHVGSPDWGPACGTREPSQNRKKRETAAVMYNTVQLLTTVSSTGDTVRLFYGPLRALPAGTAAASSSSGFTTYTQGGWGASPSGGNPGALLSSKFSTVYPGGSVIVGGTKRLTFTSASAITAFLPQGGTPNVLGSSATNPMSCSGGVFAGQVLALRLNVDFSAAGLKKAGLGNLVVKSGPLVGYTVTQVLALANTVLGGNTSALPSGLTVSGLNGVVHAINYNYDNGTVDKGYLE